MCLAPLGNPADEYFTTAVRGASTILKPFDKALSFRASDFDSLIFAAIVSADNAAPALVRFRECPMLLRCEMDFSATAVVGQKWASVLHKACPLLGEADIFQPLNVRLSMSACSA